MLAASVQCEKMNISGDVDDANVVLRVLSFEQTPFGATTRADVTQVCNRLNFVVFSEEGERVEQINQELGEAGFGAGYFNLAEGSYQLAIVAHSSDGNPTVNKRTASKHESIAFTNARSR